MICVISYMLCSNLIYIKEYVQKLFSMELLISDFQLHHNFKAFIRALWFWPLCG